MTKRWTAPACLALSLALAGAADPKLNDGLRDAARKGELENVKSLIAKGAEVNAASEFGATALLFAADGGHTDVVKLLLVSGADVNQKDTTYGSSPIDWAAGKGYAPIVEMLLAHGATGGVDALSAAIDKDYVEVVKVVLASGKVAKEQLSGPLTAARKGNHPAIVELLEKAGAVPLPKASDMVAADVLATYVGAYRNDGGFEINILLNDGHLMVSFAGRDPLELSPKEANLFQVVGAGPTTASFNVEAGQVTGLTVKPPETGTLFKKVPKTP